MFIDIKSHCLNNALFQDILSSTRLSRNPNLSKALGNPLVKTLRMGLGMDLPDLLRFVAVNVEKCWFWEIVIRKGLGAESPSQVSVLSFVQSK